VVVVVVRTLESSWHDLTTWSWLLLRFDSRSSRFTLQHAWTHFHFTLCSSTVLQESCVGVAWHKDDHHCHILVGNATHDKLVAALKKDITFESCFIVK
jgi:hypothetical protein